MPIEFMDGSATTAASPGGTLFERMRRASQMPASEGQDLITVDITGSPASDTVRFDRADVEGKPGVIMQERGSDGVWRESWSWAAQSLDAREGMIGWLNTQSHRWDRFARMLHRRGADELTAWIFELMVLPSTADARPPRFEPQRWATIDQYDAPRFSQSTQTASRQRARPMLDDCSCRPRGVQHSRNF
jgi:hypothetical protein